MFKIDSGWALRSDQHISNIILNFLGEKFRSTIFAVRPLQWWAGYIFFIDGIFFIFAITFDQRVIWTWNLFFLKEHHLGDILNTHVMVVWPTEKFLESSEKKFYLQKQRFSHILTYKWSSKNGDFNGTGTWKSLPSHIRCNKNRSTHRRITPFVSADTHGPKKVSQSKFWILKSIQNFFTHFKSDCLVRQKALFFHAISAEFS